MSVVVSALVSALVGKRKLSAWTDKNRAYHFATHDHGSCDDTFVRDETPTANRTARPRAVRCAGAARAKRPPSRRANSATHTRAHDGPRPVEPGLGSFRSHSHAADERDTVGEACRGLPVPWGPCLGAENLLTDERQSHGSPREVDTFPGTESRLPTPVPPRSRPRDAAGRATRCENGLTSLPVTRVRAAPRT